MKTLETHLILYNILEELRNKCIKTKNRLATIETDLTSLIDAGLIDFNFDKLNVNEILEINDKIEFCKQELERVQLLVSQIKKDFHE